MTANRRERAEAAADELCGVLVDAMYYARQGADAYRWLKVAVAKVRRVVAELTQEPTPPPANGAAKPKSEVNGEQGQRKADAGPGAAARQRQAGQA